MLGLFFFFFVVCFVVVLFWCVSCLLCFFFDAFLLVYIVLYSFRFNVFRGYFVLLRCFVCFGLVVFCLFRASFRFVYV